MHQDQSRTQSILSDIDTIRQRILQQDTLGQKDSLYAQVFMNLYHLFSYKWIFHGDNKAQNHLRDSIMAENLIWIQEKRYPTRKIIVWAANSHILNFADADGYTRMGNYLKQHYTLVS
jgi:erythromycin esterase-like protein